MKASLFKVDPSARSSFRCVRVRNKRLGAPWHFHPEYQLTLVIQGTGQRVVGDSITPIGPGDLTLFGPNVPHFWDIDLVDREAGKRQRVEAVVVQFSGDFLGRDFWNAVETAPIARLLRTADRGLAFPMSSQRRVAGDILRLPALKGLERLIGLLRILGRLAHRGRPGPICSEEFLAANAAWDRDRLGPVIRAIQEQLGTCDTFPGRRELAALAGLSERSFSRSFRSRMGRTLPQFVNELRVGRARRMLVETDLPVTQVAHDCGFHNLSNFNSQFRTLAGTTPLLYRIRHRGAMHAEENASDTTSDDTP